MSTILTLDQLKQMVKNPHIEHWYRALEALLDDYEINTPQRIAAFIAQCAHESGNFVFIKENLNYRAPSLRKTFAKYLDSPTMRDVDLFLRSSGEQRTSNFLPWQSVYAEMVFMDVFWPDVTRKTLWKAIEEYNKRERRFGKA